MYGGWEGERGGGTSENILKFRHPNFRSPPNPEERIHMLPRWLVVGVSLSGTLPLYPTRLVTSRLYIGMYIHIYIIPLLLITRFRLSKAADARQVSAIQNTQPARQSQSSAANGLK